MTVCLLGKMTWILRCWGCGDTVTGCTELPVTSAAAAAGGTTVAGTAMAGAMGRMMMPARMALEMSFMGDTHKQHSDYSIFYVFCQELKAKKYRQLLLPV
jgi:hypothetical protein